MFKHIVVPGLIGTLIAVGLAVFVAWKAAHS